MANRSLRGLSIISAALMLAACSSTSTTTPLAEQEITNAETVLAEAETLFNQQVATDLPVGSTTLESGGKCFLSGAGAVPEPILHCGPVRHLGADEPAWHSIPMTLKASRDGLILSINPNEDFLAPEIQPQGLHRPDGLAAPAFTDLPEPEAPPFPESNFARLLDEGSLDSTASWEVLEEPAVLNAPAATFRVTARAHLDSIPASMTESDTPVPHYLPAEGQEVTAWKLEVLESVVPGPTLSGWGSRDGARDASARLSVPSGNQRLPVERESSLNYWGSDSGAFAVDCTSGVPCDPDTARYVLFTSVGAADARLIVSTDGQDQVLNLEDGTLESSVSAVADERPQLETRLSTTWPRQEHTILTPDEADEAGLDYVSSDITLTYAGQLDSAYLSPFHWEGGWAEPGRAWLTIPVNDDPQQLSNYHELNYDQSATYTLEVGEEVIEVADVGTQTFDVPATFTDGVFHYRPTGNVVVENSPVAFEVDEGLSIEITFEE